MDHHWLIDPTWTFLNHGSFGARLTRVHEHQNAWRRQLEAQPLRFFLDDYLPALARAQSACAAFIGAEPEDIVFVPNATYGVNSVLRSWRLNAGDEVLMLDHAYGACRAALEHLVAQQGARVVTVELPFPCPEPGAVVARVLSACSQRTRFAMIDAVTSPSAWVLPVDELVSELQARGVETLVDAAHTPGMLPMDIKRSNAAYTAGNLHKWLGAPLGAAFLHVRSDLQHQTLPSNLSYGLGFDAGRQWRESFDWTGTFDPSAWLSIPFVLEQFAQLAPGGATQVMANNRELARQARRLLVERLDLPVTCPEAMLGSMASLILPLEPQVLDHHLGTDPLQRWLGERHRIEVPIITFAGKRLLRISCHAYNELGQFDELAQALQEGLAQAP